MALMTVLSFQQLDMVGNFSSVIEIFPFLKKGIFTALNQRIRQPHCAQGASINTGAPAASSPQRSIP